MMLTISGAQYPHWHGQGDKEDQGRPLGEGTGVASGEDVFTPGGVQSEASLNMCI